MRSSHPASYGSLLGPVLVLAGALLGCAGGPPSGPGAPSDAGARNPDRGSQPSATVVDARPAALIGGRRISWGDLRPILSEMAGAEALNELLLDRAVDSAAAEAGIEIGPDDIAGERRRLLESLSDDPDRAVRLLEELRARKGLGPRRFQALMRRNAILRAMVRDDVEVTETAMRQMHEAVHGAKRQPRLIVVPTLRDARAAIERIEAGERFADVAVERSTDASAPRGGLLEPISLADPSYPDALRLALWRLQPREVSGPILLGEQYGILKLVRELEGDGTEFDQVREAMARRVRLHQERIRMDQLARALTADVRVTIFDDSLRADWGSRERGRR